MAVHIDELDSIDIFPCKLLLHGSHQVEIVGVFDQGGIVVPLDYGEGKLLAYLPFLLPLLKRYILKLFGCDKHPQLGVIRDTKGVIMVENP